MSRRFGVHNANLIFGAGPCDLPDQAKIACTARVVWTELLTGLEKNDFKTGVEFQQISERDLGVLRSFIKEHQNLV